MLKKTESAIDQTSPSQAGAEMDAAPQTNVPQSIGTPDPGPTASTESTIAETPEASAAPPLPVGPVTTNAKGGTVTYLPFVTPTPDDDKPLSPDERDDGDRVAPIEPKHTAGSVVLNSDALCKLRHRKLFSQQDLADDLYRRNFQISIATIKRAERGHRVRFRIVRELARYFGVDPEHLL